MTTWLVTGGAGYIGGHVVRAFLAAGHTPIVLDDFSSGLVRRVPAGVPVVEASVQDVGAVRRALTGHRVDGVVHLAAKKAAGESVELPEFYFRENVGGMVGLLEAMRAAHVRNLVYSSSAAVYGTPAANPVDEDAPLIPQSPYGQTKVVGEWLAQDAAVAWGLSWTALRYFNVAGAGADELGDTSVNNLIPMVFAALDAGQRPRIFGDDYPTADGTCVRDYIHVQDLADAHVAAAAWCASGPRAEAINVGRGVGASVRQVLAAISAEIGRDVGAEVVARRPGDPPATFAAIERAERVLRWRASRDLPQMVASAWSAHRRRGPNCR